ncbi:MAG: DNA-cytosine methyltransferase [Alphaproteobacteria bacterium HGW-Alphaproteobacteria-15]|nr:MAG: DNA-cytosine methyltransferase [Alphaproteobacteria bacterium HGW-Alphaproteobacteria-15]
MAEKRLTSLARKLRREPTEAEQRLWSRLRAKQLGARFTRQFPIGGFIADFACRSLRLVIEVDGGQHAENPADAARTQVIEAHGYRVIRFWNNDVLGNTDGVIAAIMRELEIARNL